jgi:hypothetical protein
MFIMTSEGRYKELPVEPPLDDGFLYLIRTLESIYSGDAPVVAADKVTIMRSEALLALSRYYRYLGDDNSYKSASPAAPG